MKICHVISSLDPASGGPVTVVIYLAAAQAALNHEVWIITNSRPDQKGHAALWPYRVPGWDKVNVVPCKEIGRATQILRLRHDGALKPVISACDIVHLHGVWDVILWEAATLARKSRTIYVVTPHGMLDPWSLEQKKWKKKLALSLGFGRMLKRAAFLHLLNAAERRLIEPLSLPCETVIIPNGVCPDDIAQLPPKGSFRESHPELSARPFILFLGRLHYKKGLAYLIDAFSLVLDQRADVDLVIAGPDGGDQHKVQRRVQELQLARRVHFTGPLYGRDKFAALVDATALCLPSRQEGFSISIIEALACKLPVVISPHCHFDEVAEVGAGEIVELEPRAISTAISRLINDDGLRHRAGEAGHSLVVAHFTWPKIAVEMINAYEHALSNSSPAALAQRHTTNTARRSP